MQNTSNQSSNKSATLVKNDPLQQDTQDAFSLLLNANTHELNHAELLNQIQLFRDRISTYSEDTISFLKRACYFYIESDKSKNVDLLKRVIHDTFYYTPDYHSELTKSLMDSITAYQKVDDSASERKALAKVWGDKDSAILLEPNATERIAQNSDSVYSEMKKIYNDIFKNLKPKD